MSVYTTVGAIAMHVILPFAKAYSFSINFVIPITAIFGEEYYTIPVLSSSSNMKEMIII